MSTAGKVLVFLTVPLIIVWIALMSAIAHYNRQGSMAMQKLENEQAKIADDITKARLATAAAKDELNNEQVATSRELAVIQDKKYAAQKQLSDTTEATTRVTIDLEDQQKALKAANLNRDHRIAENQQMQKDLDTAAQEVERLKQVDRDQRAQLKKLRDEFKKIYEENKNRIKVVKQGE